MRGQQRARGLLGFAPLPPRAGEVGVQPSAPLGGGKLAGMEPSPGVQRCAGVAEGPVDADAVEGDLGRGNGERLPVNGMVRQPCGGPLGFDDQLQGAVPVVGLGGIVRRGTEHLRIGGTLGWGDQAGRLQPTSGGEGDLVGDALASSWRRTMPRARAEAAIAIGEPDIAAFVVARSAVILLLP